MDGIEPRLFGNLALSMMMVHKAILDTMPFLFPEVAEDMVEFQVRALVDEMERTKESLQQVKEDGWWSVPMSKQTRETAEYHPAQSKAGLGQLVLVLYCLFAPGVSPSL